MKHTFAIVSLGAAALLLSSCGLTPSKIAAMEKQVLAAHAQMVAAAEKLDAETMFEFILDSDETVIQSGSRVQNRQEALKSTRKSFEGLRSLHYEFAQKQVTVLSPTTAEMAVKGTTIAVTGKERTFNVQFTQTLRFVRTKTGWKMKYAHHVVEAD